MTDEKKPTEIIFAPGCFDDFEGTQEELDELVAEINRLAESGELFEKSTPVSIDDLSDDDLEQLAAQLGITEEDLEDDDLEDDDFIDVEPTEKSRKLH